jgi:two-component system, NtrC family, sensor kinase
MKMRSFIGSSIVWKLTVFAGIFVALNGAILIGVAYWATSAILRDQIHERLATVAAARQEVLVLALHQQMDQTANLANLPGIQTLLLQPSRGPVTSETIKAEIATTVFHGQASPSGVAVVWIEDESGNLIAASGAENLVTEYRQVRGSGERPADGLIVPPRRTGGPVRLLSSATIRSPARQALGTIVLLADIGPTASLLFDPRGLGDTGEVIVGVKAGEVIRLLFSPRRKSPVAALTMNDMPVLSAATEGRIGFERTTDYRGENVLASYRPVGEKYPGWGLVVKMDTAEADLPVTRLRGLLLALGGAALLLGLGASSAIARRFARPIRQLARSSAAVAAGDLSVRSEVTSSDEIGSLSTAFNRMTEELARSYSTLERRITERTRDLETARDELDAFFQISTSRVDPHNIDKTVDSVLQFCSRLGYDLAMISLVDRAAGVIRAERALGTMAQVVEQTVRRVDGNDILAIVVRDGHAIVVADSRLDPRCEQAAVALSGIRGQIVVPLVSDEVLGTLQVASHQPLDPERVDLRPLETLASHTARALTGLRQIEEIRRLQQTQEQHADELARSEAALREKTRILQSVLDCMGDGVIVADSSAQFLVFNPAAQRIMGHGWTDAPAREWSRLFEIFLPDRQTPYPVEELPLMRAIRGEATDQAELYVAYPSRDDGTWILVTGRPLRDEQGALQGGVVVFHDITRRKKADRRLAAQYETTRVLAEADSPGQSGQKILETICDNLDWDLGALWRVDTHIERLRCAAIWHRPSAPSPSFETQTRDTALCRGVGLPGRVWADSAAAWIPELAVDSNFPRQDAAIVDGLHAAFAVPILLRGDTMGVLEFFSRQARPADLAILEMMNSVGTQIGQFIERHRMRARVIQSEKLASLGMLSAGVAHEINNPLAYVSNNLAVIERDVRFLLALLAIYEEAGDTVATARPDLSRKIEELGARFDSAYVQENMEKILQSTRQGVKRVADIVQNLRGFARLDRAAVDQADIHEALRSALEMLRGRLDRRNIKIDEHLSELPLVAGSPAQLNQVFLNLLVNAMQAIESTHRADGRIAITAVLDAGEVAVEIADNGCGIAEEILPQIFDPFFTTKAVGDGTGLGLTITHGMVQDYGGRLLVESVLGEGTSFRVILPVARS